MTARAIRRHGRLGELGAALGVALLILSAARPAPAADLHVHRETLDNGLVIQVVERPALPIVSVELAVRAGTRHDPLGKAGLANMVAALLTEGTESRTAPQIAEEIEFVGGTIGSGARRDYALVAVSVLSRDLNLALDLLADVARHPAFRTEDVERVRSGILATVQADQDRPGRVSSKAFGEAVYGDHPYGRLEEGIPEQVRAFTRDDLERFHRLFYRPNNAVLSFVGDVTPRQARKLARKMFGDWEPDEVPQVRYAVPEPPEHTRLIKIDRHITQANVVMGHVGVARGNPDFYPLMIMNYILGGGGLTSRLADDVRDRQGLAYSIYSDFEALEEPGPFQIRFQTRNASANQAIKSVMEEVRRIREEPVSETELSEAKSYLAGSFPLRLDTNGKTASLLTFIDIYGLGLNYFADYLDRVNAVTVEDVQRVARQYLHPDHMVWVVVANQQEADLRDP